jgi:acetylglutamate kinase
VSVADPVCIVHGGGDEVSSLQRRLGSTPQFRGGRRVTTADDLEVVRMVLSATVNKRLVAQLVGAGVRAVGVSGEDAGMLEARATDRETLGEVGAPTRVDRDVLDALLSRGFVPVISPLARDEESGGTLNVNGDDAAAAFAVALGATELLLIADVPGVLIHGTPVATLDLDAAANLIASGTARDGMAAKLEAARRALEGGVPAVRIGNLQAISAPHAGTSITRPQIASLSSTAV